MRLEHLAKALDLSTWYFSMRYLTDVAGMGSLDMAVDYAQAGVRGTLGGTSAMYFATSGANISGLEIVVIPDKIIQFSYIHRC